MPTVGFGRINADATLQEVIERIGKLEKTLEYLFGGLDTKNIREIGGWLVNPTEIISKDGDVGMSTEDTGGDDIRFWAGDKNKNNANFKVRKSGKLEATGALIQSSKGFPMVVIDPTGQLIGAYGDATSYVALLPSLGGVPAYIIVDNNSNRFTMNYHPINNRVEMITSVNHLLRVFGELRIDTTFGNVVIDSVNDVIIQSDSDILLNGNVYCQNGASGTFETADGKTVTVEDGIITDIS